MEIEFAKFYPVEKNTKTKTISGIITIRIPEKKIKIQGILAIKKGVGQGNGVWKFNFPRIGKEPNHTLKLLKNLVNENRCKKKLSDPSKKASRRNPYVFYKND